MGLPLLSENLQSYVTSSLYKRAEHMRGKDLFLVHGMADANVHLQNSMVLANHLVAHNVPFQQQVSQSMKVSLPIITTLALLICSVESCR